MTERPDETSFFQKTMLQEHYLPERRVPMDIFYRDLQLCDLTRYFAVARKLLIDLWRYLDNGATPKMVIDCE